LHETRHSRLAVAGSLLFWLATSFSAFAATVTGTVRNQDTGAFLEGAEVTVPAAGLRALSARDGSYVLTDVPAGVQLVKFFYTGLDVATKSLEVGSGGTVEANVSLTSNVQQLEAFTVSTSRIGEAASITKQRNADNVVNVVSTEAFGNVADGNIGNFMVRLPGVSGEFENGEVVGIKIRGTPVEFSALNVDGVRAAGAFSGFNTQGDRGAQSDQLPAEFIKEVEVTKAPTPDQPADSIGGSTNLVTKSALDFNESVLTYRVGVNYNTFRDDLRNDARPNAALTYLTRVGAKRNIGVALSLSYTDTEAPRDRVQMQRSQVDGRNTQARSLSNVNQRVRFGSGLKFDYRYDRDTSIYAKFQYNYYYFDSPRQVYAASVAGSGRVADYSKVSRAQIEAGTAARDSANATAGVAPGYTDSFTEMVGATWLNEATWNVKLGRQYLAEVGGQKKFSGDQKLTFQASYNPSNFASNLRSFDLRLVGNIGITIDTSANRSRPQFRQTYGPSIGFGTDPRSYTARMLQQPETSREYVDNAKMDYTKVFHETRLPWELKSGLTWREQHRWNKSARPNWTLAGPDGVAGTVVATGVNDDNLGQFLLPSPVHPLFNGEDSVWPSLPGINYPVAWQSFTDHPELFKAEGTSVTAPPSFNNITEDVSAGYVQGRAQFGKLGVLTGVRFERTQVDASGARTDPKNTSITRAERKRSYTDAFPSLHFRYEARPGLLARASVSTGAARPNMSDLYPVTTVSYDSTTGLGTVKQNDAGLKPQYSTNYDVSLEYYFEPAGVISAGWFHKDIKDFLARSNRELDGGADNGFDGDFAGFTLSTTSNGGAAKIDGFELNYNQQLTMLPSPLNSLRLFGNYTELRTSGTYAGGVSELVGFVPRTGNTGLSFLWRKLESRVAYNYTSGYLSSYNAVVTSQQRRRPWETVDLNFQYRFKPQVAVFVDVINVFNHWPEFYTGKDRGRVIISDIYGVRLNVGVTGRF
jgi:TonB-dependent receptor